MVALPEMRSPTLDAIEAAVVAADPERGQQDSAVRCSAIGKCGRHLWYRFRWAHAPDRFEGRMLRLFDMGHQEEDRMVGWLRLAGLTVTHQQEELTDFGGHLAGHIDGQVVGVIEAPVARHLLECKTHNAKSFEQLKRHGVAVSKPEHMAQMQIYMELGGWPRAFYLAENKDTSELYAERVERDPVQGERLMLKARDVITSDEPPPKIADNADAWVCRFCPSAAVCHGGEWAPRNCRTCLHADPVLDAEGGRWRCTLHGRPIGKAKQEQGCSDHLFLPALVPGEQVDAEPSRRRVTYELRDGKVWIDGEREGVAA